MSRKPTCGCDECPKCRHRKYMRAWYALNADRARKTARSSRTRRIDAVRAYDRQRGFRIYDLAKVHARQAVARALRAGKLVRGSCEVCGEPGLHAHHDDYSKPLEVRWLCPEHHGEIHRTVGSF